MATSRKPSECAKAHRFVELGAEHLGEMHAVHFPGQGIELRELDERLLALMALSDRTHGSECAQWLAVATREPAAGVLQPDFLVAAAPEDVLHLIGHAFAGVALTGLGDRVEATLPVLRLDLLRKASAAGDIAEVGDAEHRRGIAAPDQGIGVEPPFVSDVTDRLENFRGVGDASRLSEFGSRSPLFGNARSRRTLSAGWIQRRSYGQYLNNSKKLAN